MTIIQNVYPAPDLIAFFVDFALAEQTIQEQTLVLQEARRLLEEDEETITSTIRSLQVFCSAVDILKALIAASTNETIELCSVMYLEQWGAVWSLATDVILFVEAVHEVLDLRGGRELLVMIEDCKIALGHLLDAIEEMEAATATWRQLVERESRPEGGEA